MKGLDIDQPLTLRTLLTGPNGAGKSARLQALILAVKGYVPGGAKTNAEILTTYGIGKDLRVGYQVDDLIMEREFHDNGKDTVSQVYRVNGAKVTKEIFAQAQGKSDIRILDLAAFMAVSDSKKIDHVLTLYPPAGNVSQMLAEIEEVKGKINAQNQKHKSAEDVAARLTAQHASMGKPAGTAAENDAEIVKVEADIEDTRKEIEAENIRIAEEAAAAKATKDAEIKAAEALRVKAAVSETKTTEVPVITEQSNAQPNTVGNDEIITKIEKGMELEKGTVKVTQAISSLKYVLNSINEAGCEACAAGLVTKREINNFLNGGAQ